MRIKWIGQSGYILNTGKTEIIIDPYLSDVVNRVANRPRLVDPPINPRDVKSDAVICTHDHLDHLDPDAIEKMDKSLTFITTREGKEKLNAMGFDKVFTLQLGKSVIIGDFTITAVYANHTVEAFGLIVKAEGNTLYFSGDTLFDKQLYKIQKYSPDITFICINGKLGNMNYEEAAVTARIIGAKINIPTHYGMFASNTEDPENFTRLVDNGFIMEFDKEYIIRETHLEWE